MNATCQKWNLDPQKLPRHIGIIMDGNGRWATGRHLPRVAGHRKGVERVRQTIELAAHLGVESLTLFAFSDENWRRPEDEVSSLMNLLRWYLRNERQRILKEDIRFHMIGDRGKISNDILQQITSLENESMNNRGMDLNIALSYGARGEILRAVKKIVTRVQKNEIFLDQIDENMFSEHLDTAHLPPVDLLIRTSGEMRISNFMLWQIAYAELYFESIHWPDFDNQTFTHILRSYAGRERRFGLTPEQMNANPSARL